MQSHRSNGGKPAREKWHKRRHRARREAFSDEEFSASERTEFDLDNDDPLYPARIYGDQNPETFTIEGPDGQRHDVRETNPRI